jgi:hypothetical protein
VYFLHIKINLAKSAFLVYLNLQDRGMSLFFLLARNYYKRTKCPFFAQCKATQNKIAWAHCMFFADHVAELSGARNFQLPKLRPIPDSRHCCKNCRSGCSVLNVFPIRYRHTLARMIRKASSTLY